MELEGRGNTCATRATRAAASPLAAILGRFRAATPHQATTIEQPPAAAPPPAQPAADPPPATAPLAPAPAAPPADPAAVAVLSARLAAFRDHVHTVTARLTWRHRDPWRAENWQAVVNVVGYCIADFLEPAAAAGDVAAFDGWERHLREKYLQ